MQHPDGTSLRERLVDFFFGYDFFVSYRWSDGRVYALRLRDELAHRGLVVFLDSSDFEYGESWRRQAQRALRRSSRLLLVGSPQVHASEAVARELDLFSRSSQRMMPIDGHCN
jgi:hypothetical protein